MYHLKQSCVLPLLPPPFIHMAEFCLWTGREVVFMKVPGTWCGGQGGACESSFRRRACFPKRDWWPGAVHPGQDEENALLSFLRACSRPSRVSGIPDMSDVPIAQGWKHCSLGDTEACLPRALCSPG